MTRAEVLSYAYALKLNYTVDLNKMPDFAQTVIELLSFEPKVVPISVIEDIKAEIEETQRKYDVIDDDWHNHLIQGLEIALGIIDNRISGKDKE